MKLVDYADQCSQGMPPHLLREISALMELGEYNSPYLVKLHNLIVRKSQVLMFFEYCPNDLSMLIRDKR